MAALVVLRRRGRAGAPRHRGRTKASEETGFPKRLMDGLRGHVPDVLVDFSPDRGSPFQVGVWCHASGSGFWCCSGY